LICRSWESQQRFWIFSKEKIKIIQANTDDNPLPTSSIDIQISENPQTKFQKIEIDSSSLIFC
jgi:hypothetical protein